MSNLVARTYDALGGDYFSGKHSTTQFMYLLQDAFLSGAVLSTREFNPKFLDDTDVLVIGAGATGNARQTTAVLNESAQYGDRALNYDRITYLDISRKALEALIEDFADTMARSGGICIPGMFVQGDGKRLPFKEDTFDVVLAGLCDHILPWEHFFQEVRRVLRENGAFITTYPASELFTAVREKVYGCPRDKTRFIADGKELFLDSLTVSPEQLNTMYSQFGFRQVRVDNICYKSNLAEQQPFLKAHNFTPSATIQKAAQEIGIPIEEIPILVGGIGFKQ